MGLGVVAERGGKDDTVVWWVNEGQFTEMENTEVSEFVVDELPSHVRLFVIPWTAAHQNLLSSTISRSLLKLMSIELVTPSNHLILCHPLLLLPSVFPSIRVFPNESALCIRWPKS